jgi:transaldolase
MDMVERRKRRFGLLFGDPASFLADLDEWTREQHVQLESVGVQEAGADMAMMAVELASGLPDWNLVSEEVEVEDLDARSKALLATLRADFHADDVADEAGRRIGEIRRSNLLALSRLYHQTGVPILWGNDFATGTYGAMLKGGLGLVTTNPVLVGLAAKNDPQTWVPVRDRLREEHPGASPEEIAELMTIEVVVANALLLRRPWELWEEKLGCVSLQLSPKIAFNAQAMITQAERVWPVLGEKLGGKPNCVFKVPGTYAGLEVAAHLTSRGIGVNVTLNFAIAQQRAFAHAINLDSQAALSFRTQMDGRVDDPIGEELEAAGVPDWEKVKRWATTAIRQQDYMTLVQPPAHGGLGIETSYCLAASGRGPWNILNSLPFGPGRMYFTIFPSRQVEFDAEPRELVIGSLHDEIPAGVIADLRKSKLFNQSYDPDGMTVEEFDTYLPLERTLAEFSEAYDRFCRFCAGEPVDVLEPPKK